MEFFIDYLWTPFLVFLLGFLFIKVTGKRSVTQMNSFDLMFILIIGITISGPVITSNNWAALWYSIIVALCYMALSRLILVKKFKPWLTSSPTVLIRGGEIDEYGLEKVRLSVDELLGALRIEGYTNTKDIEMALMEETGRISVIPKSDKRPLQPGDIQLQPSPTFISIPLIIDGEILHRNLKFIEKDLEWLYMQMQAYNLNKEEIKSITLATYNQRGIVDFDVMSQ